MNLKIVTQEATLSTDYLGVRNQAEETVNPAAHGPGKQKQESGVIGVLSDIHAITLIK